MGILAPPVTTHVDVMADSYWGTSLLCMALGWQYPRYYGILIFLLLYCATLWWPCIQGDAGHGMDVADLKRVSPVWDRVRSDQCAFFRVGNETRGWTEGGVVYFDDSFEHEVRGWVTSCAKRDRVL